MGCIAQLTLAQFVQAVLLAARQLEIAGTLGRVDVDRIGRIRWSSDRPTRAGATEESLQKAHRLQFCHADDRVSGGGEADGALTAVVNTSEASSHASSRAPSTRTGWRSLAGVPVMSAWSARLVLERQDGDRVSTSS